MKTAYLAAAGTAAAATTGPGRLLGVQVLTLGTAGMKFYDSATTTSTAGLTLLALAASSAAGFYQLGATGFGVPYQSGIWMAGATNTPEVLVVYSPGIPNDGRPAV